MSATIVTSDQLYWITRLDGLRDAMAGMGGAVLLFGLIGCCFMPLVWMERSIPRAVRWCSSLFFAGLALAGCVAIVARPFVPTTKEAVIIYGVPAVVNDPKVQEEAGAALDGTKELLSLAKGYIAEKLKGEDKGRQDACVPGKESVK